MQVTEGKPRLTKIKKMKNAWLRLQRDWRIFAVNSWVSFRAKPNSGSKPIAFFNASTRLGGFSQNAAFSLLSSWSLQLSSIPVVHFACESGMSRCVLGTNIDDVSQAPPCKGCISQTKRLFKSAKIHWFDYQHDVSLETALSRLSVDELSHFQFKNDDPDRSFSGQMLPLGQLVLPALRWALRRHHLVDDEATRFLFRSYIQSAYRIVNTFDQFLSQTEPQALVIFNGIMYPEAAARWVSINLGLRVITHEVGFRPFSAFFTDGHATAYPMAIPEKFELSTQQNAILDEYLNRRFMGQFTMAGIRFWPKISDLDQDFLETAKRFKQIVPVFTNVVNDTSQVHASSVFAHMYDWLECVRDVIQANPETFFVIRAHPDEKRLGTRKHSRQPVSDWVVQNEVDQLSNVIFVDSNEPLSSYALIRKSKFVIVYNSSIGLEASLLGVPVLCGGKARYTQYPTVFFPQTPTEFKQMAEEFLVLKDIEVPDIFKRNARRVLFWQLFRTSLPFDRYINAHPTPGYVQLSPFSLRELQASQSTTVSVLLEGIVNGEPFIMPE